MKKNRIFVIVGPTASGKTAVSVKIAEWLNAEIVSADSIQIYRGMDIGSAKPTHDEMCGIRHHMIDIVDIDDDYNVALFRKQAGECIDDIIARGKLPLICGGTGLYVNSLVYPLNFSSAEPSFKRRSELAEIETNAPGTLHLMLNEFDPQTAARLHPNDTKRIIRAIEVYESTGETMSSCGGDFINERNAEIEYQPIIAGITMDRAKLYSRIEHRVDVMMQNGFLNEVKQILNAGFDRSIPALQGLGYKQLIMHLSGECTLDEAVELIKRDTRRFAKRQISWFKRDKRIRWFDADSLVGEELTDSIFEYFVSESNYGRC